MTIYYQGLGGSDGNDGLSWANRFDNFQKLIDTCSAGDIGYTNGGNISAVPDFDQYSGNSSSLIKIKGCNSSGVPLSGTGQAELSATAAITALVNYADETDYYYFEDIIFNGNGNATYCVVCNGGVAADATGWQFKNCRFTGATSHGLYVYIRGGTERPWMMVGCEIDNNGGQGIVSPTTVRCHVNMINCKIHHNDSHGGTIGASGAIDLIIVMIGNLFYRNGQGGSGNGILFDGTNPMIILHNNVFVYNADDGVGWNNADTFDNIVVCHNNIFKSNGGYAVNTNNNSVDAFLLMSNNCSNSNTSGHIDINGNLLPGNGNVTDDPNFVNEIDGLEDFTLQSDSPCIDVGFGYNG